MPCIYWYFKKWVKKIANIVSHTTFYLSHTHVIYYPLKQISY